MTLINGTCGSVSVSKRARTKCPTKSPDITSRVRTSRTSSQLAPFVAYNTHNTPLGWFPSRGLQ
eukprot:8109326-Prorocentrum_lima.AAC.1